jgi:purine-binding chemotaxis protein CheW
MTMARGNQIVTFRLGDDLFAADINDVERVLRYAEPTPVPNVPPWVQGVIEYRSRVVPVIDLRVRFELPEVPTNGATRIMVLSANGDWIAAVVDAVTEVVSIGNATLAPPPPLFDGMAADFLKGILRRNDRLIIVLDVTRLLATRERLAFDRGVLAALPQPEPEPVPTPEPAVSAGPESPEQPPAPVVASEPPNDLMIIRGSPDPAAEGDLLLPSAGDAFGSGAEPPTSRPAVPPTPDWGTSATPRPRPSAADGEGSGHSDG